MDQQNRRTALVSGSSNGIGEAVAKGFAKLDYELVITGRNVNDIKRVADECAKLSPSKRKVSLNKKFKPSTLNFLYDP